MSAVLNQYAACFQRTVKPLMRIHRNRICLFQAFKEMLLSRNYHCRNTIGAINMKPQVICSTNRGNGFQIINHTGTYIPGVTDHHDWLMTAVKIVLYGLE